MRPSKDANSMRLGFMLSSSMSVHSVYFWSPLLANTTVPRREGSGCEVGSVRLRKLTIYSRRLAWRTGSWELMEVGEMSLPSSSVGSGGASLGSGSPIHEKKRLRFTTKHSSTI